MFVRKLLAQPGMRAAVFPAFPNSLTYCAWQFQQRVLLFHTALLFPLPQSVTAHSTLQLTARTSRWFQPKTIVSSTLPGDSENTIWRSRCLLPRSLITGGAVHSKPASQLLEVTSRLPDRTCNNTWELKIVWPNSYGQSSTNCLLIQEPLYIYNQKWKQHSRKFIRSRRSCYLHDGIGSTWHEFETVINNTQRYKSSRIICRKC
jgi:hypothetical protein